MKHVPLQLQLFYIISVVVCNIARLIFWTFWRKLRSDKNSGFYQNSGQNFLKTQIFRDFQIKALQERQKSPEFAHFSHEIAEKLRSWAEKLRSKVLKLRFPGMRSFGQIRKTVQKISLIMLAFERGTLWQICQELWQHFSLHIWCMKNGKNAKRTFWRIEYSLWNGYKAAQMMKYYRWHQACL